MRKSLVYVLLGLCNLLPGSAESRPASSWKSHDMQRPRPPVLVAPLQALPLAPPEDAVILFNGTDLSGWVGDDQKSAQWLVRDGVMETVQGTGAIHTAKGFGDVQLHLEWATPVQAMGSGQGRGNSGVILMGLYEIQILDSFENDTYPDGQAAAVYGQYPPLFNVSRPPGEWQSYDIFFRRPRFDGDGKLISPARITLLHNGVLVQNNVELLGPTAWLRHRPYEKHADKLPLTLQDHSNPVRFRNLWVRELPEEAAPVAPAVATTPVRVDRRNVEQYLAVYGFAWGGQVFIRHVSEQLWFEMGSTRIALIPGEDRRFYLDGVDASVVFTMDTQQGVSGLVLYVGGGQVQAARLKKQ